MRRQRPAAWCVIPIVMCLTSACEREARPFQDLDRAAGRSQGHVLSPLFPGGTAPPAPEYSPFQENAWGISEGKRLYEAFNCAGCHAHGGGAMGPPLMDDEWIYGSQPANVFATVVEGRPNGMPSFRNKIGDAQVWQIVAYVQSMSGQAPMAALPGRSDHMRSGTVESQRPAEQPVQTGRP
jgi:cytochrome c oxidase cbb3-type subunit 3